jgi:DNA-binding response OmpR family regulator
MQEARVLVVEDDATTRMSIVAVLEGSGYNVEEAADGETAITRLQGALHNRNPYDVVITDIRMGTVDGVEVLYAARDQDRPPEVIILTGFGTMDTAIAALRAGAHDYLTKPCKPQELLTYVEGAVSRRLSEQRRDDALRMISQAIGHLQGNGVTPQAGGAPAFQENTSAAGDAERYLSVGALSIDTFQHTVLFNGQPVHLTPIEYELLACLAEARGRALSYQEIASHTHHHHVERSEAHGLLKTHVQNLRRKIGPDYIVSIRGTGYLLVDPEQQQSGQ